MAYMYASGCLELSYSRGLTSMRILGRYPVDSELRAFKYFDS